MPRDVNGTYTLPGGNPVVPNTTITSNWANITLSDIATALTNSLAIDGSVTNAKLATNSVSTSKIQDSAITGNKIAVGAVGTDRLTSTQLQSLANVGDGIITRIALNTVVGRTITGTANKVTVTNGDGVGGQPTITLPSVIAQDGILFPATQVSSADPNTLDDYEEGTWTPVLTFATPGNLSVAYSIQDGTYTKIGNRVYLSFRIVTSSFTHTTASGVARITGLPFSANTNLHGGGLSWSGVTVSGYTQLSCIALSGNMHLELEMSGSGVVRSQPQASHFPTGGTVQLLGQIVIRTT